MNSMCMMYGMYMVMFPVALIPYRSSMCASSPCVAQRFTHKLFVVEEHLEVIPVSQIFKRLRRVLDRQLRYVRLCEDVLVYGGVKGRAVAILLVGRKD